MCGAWVTLACIPTTAKRALEQIGYVIDEVLNRMYDNAIVTGCEDVISFVRLLLLTTQNAVASQHTLAGRPVKRRTKS
jgi:hypothetical protein